MNWNKMGNFLILQDREPELGTQGGEGNLDLNGEIDNPPNPQPEPISNPTPSGSESPFSHPALAGLSEEQLVERMHLLNETVREQGQRLNLAHRNSQNTGTQTPIPEPEPEPSFDANAFFTDPNAVLKARDEALRNNIRKDLAEAIAPFARSFAMASVDATWAEAKRKFSDIDSYRTVIDAALTERGITEPTLETLELLYYAAVGMSRTGVSHPVNNNAPVNNSPSNPQRPASPQHRPSGQPLAPQNNQPKRRQLTENERKIMREWGMNEDDFFTYLEMEDSAVATHGGNS